MSYDPISWYIDRGVSSRQEQLLYLADEVILSLVTDCLRSVKWQVPFYTYRKDLCYLNCYQDHIYVGMIQGRQLTDHIRLVKAGTKMIGKYYVKTEKDINDQAFSEILLEAIALQDMLYRK